MKIPYGRQSINQADVNAVLKVLNSDWITQGPLSIVLKELLYIIVEQSFRVQLTLQPQRCT